MTSHISVILSIVVILEPKKLVFQIIVEKIEIQNDVLKAVVVMVFKCYVNIPNRYM